MENLTVNGVLIGRDREDICQAGVFDSFARVADPEPYQSTFGSRPRTDAVVLPQPPTADRRKAGADAQDHESTGGIHVGASVV